jgi:hypothetical protein
MEYKVRLTAALPKGPANGWDDVQIAEALARARVEQRTELPRVAIIVYGVRNAEISKDHVTTAVLEILRVQPVISEQGRRAVEVMLADEYAEQTGEMMLPFDLASLSKSAFADLPRTASEIDQTEEDERDGMSPTDELRRHLERVHGRDDAASLTALEAEHRHEADHDGDLPDVLAHDREWMGWTRADIEAATAETDGEEPDDDAGHGDLPMNTEGRIVAALESDDDGTPTNDEIEGPDPDYGKDLDDEDAWQTANPSLGSGPSLFSGTDQ